MNWKKYSVGIVIALTLVACADTNGTNGAADRDGNNVEQTRYYNNAGEGMTNVRNYTDNNDFDRNRNRMNDDHYRNINNRTNENVNDGNNVNNVNDGINGNNGNSQENRYHVAEEAADKIVKEVKDVDRAYVLTTDNNAYVAAGIDNHDRNNRNDGNDLTDDVKRKIGDVVKSVDKNIDNVYISTNPDFFDLTNNYVDDVNNGEPVEGFFDQFGNTIERLFPQNRQ